MKKSFAVILVVMVAVFGYALFMNPGSVKAGDAPAVAVEKAPAVEAKVSSPSKPLTFNATAYIAGHGGHLAVIDMNTMTPPTDMEKGRIVLNEAGSEMEGKIAGMSFEEVKKSGGSHGQALISEKGEKVLVAGTLAGDVYKVNLTTGKKEGPFKVGEKFCGAIVGPDGKIYFEDMANGLSLIHI